MKLKDKVTLVTGGNSGIGRAIALNAAREGARVAIAGRDPGKGELVLRELRAVGADAAFFAADLSVETEAERMVAAVDAHFGAINVVVNNAGAGARRSAVQGAPHGIRANGVSPGWVTTDVTAGHEAVDRSASLFARMGTPDEIARAVMFLASDDASFITGQTLIVDGGLTIVDYPSQPWLKAVGAWKLFPNEQPGER